MGKAFSKLSTLDCRRSGHLSPPFSPTSDAALPASPSRPPRRTVSSASLPPRTSPTLAAKASRPPTPDPCISLPLEHDVPAATVSSTALKNLPGALQTDVPPHLAATGVIAYQGVLRRSKPGALPDLWNSAIVYAEVEQGLVRRYPPGDNDLWEHLEHGRVYDGPQDLLRRRGGFEIDKESGTVTYRLDGNAVEAAHERWTGVTTGIPLDVQFEPDVRATMKTQAFPLEGGRWLVTQPDAVSCISACEAAALMVLGVPFSEAVRLFVNRKQTMHASAGNLKALTGVDPVLMVHKVAADKDTPPADFLRDVQRQLRASKVGILSRGGHVNVLYELRLDASGESGTAVIADPYHGTYGELSFGPGKAALWEGMKAKRGTFDVTVTFPAVGLLHKLQAFERSLSAGTPEERARFLCALSSDKGYLREMARPRDASRACFAAYVAILERALDSTRCSNDVRGKFLYTTGSAEQVLGGSANRDLRKDVWRPMVGRVASEFVERGGSFDKWTGTYGVATAAYLRDQISEHRDRTRQGPPAP
jgi:hypothetical protein